MPVLSLAVFGRGGDDAGGVARSDQSDRILLHRQLESSETGRGGRRLRGLRRRNRLTAVDGTHLAQPVAAVVNARRTSF